MTVRTGIIGAGRMGREHLRRLSHIEDAEIVAVADVNETAARAQAEEYGARAFADAGDMIAMAGLNAVVIATPGNMHRQHVEMAAQAGLHILLEKPVSLSMEDALAIQGMVEKAGITTAVGYQWRNLNTISDAKEALSGEIVSMANGLWYWTTPLVSWIADRDLGGGQIVDQATHLLDLMRYLVGEIKTVYSRYVTRAREGQPGFNNWDSYALALEFENGAVGVVQATYALFADCPVPTTLDLVAKDLLIRISPGQVDIHRPGKSTQVRSNGQWGLELDRAFVRAVETGGKSGVLSDIPDAVKSLAVSLAANRSAVTGTPITISDLLAS